MQKSVQKVSQKWSKIIQETHAKHYKIRDLEGLGRSRSTFYEVFVDFDVILRVLST